MEFKTETIINRKEVDFTEYVIKRFFLRGSCGIETVVMTGNGYICNNVRWLFDFEIRTFEDTKRVIKSCKSKRTDSTMTKKRQTQHSTQKTKD
jgi:hypothetical protein